VEGENRRERIENNSIRTTNIETSKDKSINNGIKRRRQVLMTAERKSSGFE
jgi:hypothetical protein